MGIKQKSFTKMMKKTKDVLKNINQEIRWTVNDIKQSFIGWIDFFEIKTPLWLEKYPYIDFIVRNIILIAFVSEIVLIILLTITLIKLLLP